MCSKAWRHSGTEVLFLFFFSLSVSKKNDKKHYLSLLFLTREALPGRRRPLVLPVRQVPLVSQRDDARVTGARDDGALRLGIDQTVARGDKRRLQFRFRVRDLLAGEVPDEHHPFGEALEVDGRLGVGELFGVVLGGHAKLFAGLFGGEGACAVFFSPVFF